MDIAELSRVCCPQHSRLRNRGRSLGFANVIVQHVLVVDLATGEGPCQLDLDLALLLVLMLGEGRALLHGAEVGVNAGSWAAIFYRLDCAPRFDHVFLCQISNFQGI